jgi:hypothetical protein
MINLSSVKKPGNSMDFDLSTRLYQGCDMPSENDMEVAEETKGSPSSHLDDVSDFSLGKEIQSNEVNYIALLSS